MMIRGEEKGGWKLQVRNHKRRRERDDAVGNRKWTNRWLRNRKKWRNDDDVKEKRGEKMGIEFSLPPCVHFHLSLNVFELLAWCTQYTHLYKNVYKTVNRQIRSLLFHPFSPSLSTSRKAVVIQSLFWIPFWWSRWQGGEGLQKWKESESVNAKRAFGSKSEKECCVAQCTLAPLHYSWPACGCRV